MQPSEFAQMSFKRRRLQRCLRNDQEELSAYVEAVTLFGHEAGWDAAILMQVNLVLEELIVNTICYGYADGRKGTIDVLIEADTEQIRICLEDDGDAFNPFTRPPPDLTLPLEERPIGGLGIFLVRSYMDSYTYSYESGRNRIVLVKRLAPPPPEQ